MTSSCCLSSAGDGSLWTRPLRIVCLVSVSCGAMQRPVSPESRRMRIFGQNSWDKNRPDGFPKTHQVWLEAAENEAELRGMTEPYAGTAGLTPCPADAGLRPVMVGGVVAYPIANSEPCMRLSTSHGSSTAQPLSRALFWS